MPDDDRFACRDLLCSWNVRSSGMIIEKYRGFELCASRDKSLGGWDCLYFSIYRILDGRCLEDDFTTDDDSEESYIKIMKSHVDDFYENPGDYAEYE